MILSNFESSCSLRALSEVEFLRSLFLGCGLRDLPPEFSNGQPKNATSELHEISQTQIACGIRIRHLFISLNTESASEARQNICPLIMRAEMILPSNGLQ